MKKLTVILSVLFYSSYAFSLTNSVIAESDQWSPVVQIKTDAPDASGESIPGYCNATFVGKNVIITAAHCLLLAYVSKENLLEIETGHYKYVTRPDGQRVRIGYALKNRFQKHVNIELPQSLIDKVSRRGAKTQIGPSEDFAIAWWNEETPEIADMKFSTLVSPTEHAQISRTLKSFPLQVVSVNLFSVTTMDTKRMASLDKISWSGGYVHSQSNARVEEGDSGAPVFVTINKQQKLFAVVKGRATTVFSNWDVYPSVTPHLCDINKKMPTHLRFTACAQ